MWHSADFFLMMKLGDSNGKQISMRGDLEKDMTVQNSLMNHLNFI